MGGRPSRAGTTPSHLPQPLPWRHRQGTCHPSRTRACLSKAQGPPTTRTVRACPSVSQPSRPNTSLSRFLPPHAGVAQPRSHHDPVDQSQPRDSLQSLTEIQLAALWSTVGQKESPSPCPRFQYRLPPNSIFSSFSKILGQRQLPTPPVITAQVTGALLLTLVALGWDLGRGGLGLGLQPALQLRHRGEF